MVYPIIVIIVAVSILTFIMIKIVPTFEQIFADFETDMPAATVLLITISNLTVRFWYLIPGLPLGLWISIKLLKKFKAGRTGWDMFILKLPVMGNLIEKTSMARTTRTLGTLVSSGVPILEGLTITRETCGNAVFEKLYSAVIDSIREGETIAAPLKEHSKPGFHPVAMGLWVLLFSVPVFPLIFIPGMQAIGLPLTLAAGLVGGMVYFMKMNKSVVDDLVVNMVDVGEETGELDTMLNKVADTYDEEVNVITDSLMSLLEPLLIVFLGGAVGFIVISLFLPLVALIQNLGGA